MLWSPARAKPPVVTRSVVSSKYGTMRGRERDWLKKSNPIFARSDPKSEISHSDVRKGAVYLDCVDHTPATYG